MPKLDMRIEAVALLASLALALGLACDPGAHCDYPTCGASICSSPCDRYEAFGFCETKTTRCCEDRDCPVGYCEESTGYCLEYDGCSCYSDDDCPIGMGCFSTYRMCGVCMPPPPPCSEDTDCDSGHYCKDHTYCQELCCD